MSEAHAELVSKGGEFKKETWSLSVTNEFVLNPVSRGVSMPTVANRLK